MKKRATHQDWPEGNKTPHSRPRRKKPRWQKPGWLFLGALIFAGVAWNAFWYLRPVPNAIGQAGFNSYKPQTCKSITEPNGRLAYKCPSKGVRLYVPLNEISPRLRQIVVMLEDAKFYMHSGLDVEEIKNSINTNIERGKFARGASTITQQLAKNLFLSKEKSIFRKASEVPLTMRLEKELSKNQILELYLNIIEWGYDVYGVEAAARLYFDTTAAELTEEQCWLLALMIPNPKELNLWVKPYAKKSLLFRARHLTERLWQEKKMEPAEAEQAYDRFAAFLETWQNPPQDIAARKFPLVPVPPFRKTR